MEVSLFKYRNCFACGPFFCWLALAVLLGCRGSDRLPIAPVEGKVLYQGKPLEFGTVVFQPANGKTARGVIGSDGTFRLSTYDSGDGAVVGSHNVQVTCYETQRPGAPPPKVNAAGDADPGKLLIPAKYTRFYSSGLKAEVKPKDNTPFVFELK